MSQFKHDMTEKMKDPVYAYEFGRAERELEILELLEETKATLEKFNERKWASPNMGVRIKFTEALIALIKGETE